MVEDSAAPGRRWLHQLVATIVVLAVLSGGAWLSEHRPTTNDRERPFLISAAAGGTADVRTFRATVTGVDGSSLLGSAQRPTNGVWVVVSVVLESFDAPTEVSYGALTDDSGRAFAASTRLLQDFSTWELQPGVPMQFDIAFEVAEDASGLRLRLAEPISDQRLDAMSNLALDVDPSDLETWRAREQPLELAAPHAPASSGASG